MPFKSEKQRRYLWATQPALAKRWAHEYPDSNRNLPTYARKPRNNKNPEKDTTKESAMLSLRNALKPLQSSGNTAYMKAATSILTYLNIPSTEKPVAAGEDHVTPANSALGSQQKRPENANTSALEKDPDEPPFEHIPHGNKAGSSNGQEDLEKAQILEEIAPILKKMGEAWKGAQENLCRSGIKENFGPGLAIYQRACKTATVVRLGPKIRQGLQAAENSIPASLQNSPQFNNVGLNFSQLLNNINSAKTQAMWAQNPLPLGVSGGSGASSPNSGPSATYPGMQSGPKPPQPGAVNPMLAGSNASTSPISHLGGIKSQDNMPVTGPKALGGNGQAGFTGAANRHGNEKSLKIPELARHSLGIPRFQ